jgi:hypothetical protein
MTKNKLLTYNQENWKMAFWENPNPSIQHSALRLLINNQPVGYTIIMDLNKSVLLISYGFQTLCQTPVKPSNIFMSNPPVGRQAPVKPSNSSKTEWRYAYALSQQFSPAEGQ